MARFPELLTGLFREFRNSYNAGIKKIDTSLDKSEADAASALQKASTAEKNSSDAKATSTQVKDQLNNIIIENGTSDAEVIAMRTNGKGQTFATSGERLDELDQQLETNTQEIGNLTDLQTTEKSSLVGAVNEHNVQLAGTATKTELADAVNPKANQSDVRLKAVKLEQIDMTDEFLQQMAGNTPINAVPADKSINPVKTTFFRNGKNLFNKNTASYDNFVNETTGALNPNTSYVASDYIPIEENTTYTNSHGYRMAFYDGNKVFISGLANTATEPSTTSRTYTTPANAKFIRVTWLKTLIDTSQVEVGSTKTTYEVYKEYVPKENLEKFPFSPEDIPKDSLKAEQTKFLKLGKNLFNKDSMTVDNYISYITGVLTASTSYNASDYVAVEPNTAYTHNYGLSLAFYDANKSYISGLNTDGTGSAPRTFTTPVNSAYARFSVTKSATPNFQVEKGATFTGYESFKYVINYLDASTFKPEIVLPPSIPALVGKEINIYFLNELNDELAKYKIDVTCSIGKQQNERWTCVPATAGTYAMTITAYRDFLAVASATTNIVVKAATVGTGITKTYLQIGDSTTNAGIITGELLTLFGASDPMDITLLGSRGTAPNLHEGRSGWTVKNYVSDASINDAGGNPVANAFWNSTNLAFDFSDYMTRQGYAGVDYVGIHLGINDTFGYTDDAALNTEIANILSRFDIIVNSIKAYSGTTKIGILVTIPPSANQDAFGTSYANNQTQWRYKRNNFLWIKALINHFKGQEAQNIHIVPVNVNLDTENNMVTVTVPVNSRNPKTVVRQDNGVHPADIGYYQIADVIYYWLKGFES